MAPQQQLGSHIFAVADSDDVNAFFVAVEDRFGVSIADEINSARVLTPKQLIDLIVTKVDSADSDSCLSQRAFYQVRRALVRSTGIPRAAVCLETSLEQLIRRKGRRRNWRLLATNLGARKWPELRRKGYISLAVLVAVLAAFLWVNAVHSFVAAIATAIAVCGILVLATRPLRTEFPAECRAVRDLVRYVVGENPHLVDIEEHKWTKERIQHEIRNLMAHHTVVTEFDENSRFFEGPAPQPQIPI